MSQTFTSLTKHKPHLNDIKTRRFCIRLASWCEHDQNFLVTKWPSVTRERRVFSSCKRALNVIKRNVRLFCGR